MDDLTVKNELLAVKTASLTWLGELVEKQANDPNLWRVVDTSVHEEYLQSALRTLHGAIENLR